MTRGIGNYDTRGPGEGTWAVFAEKCMAERDEANALAATMAAEASRLRAELAEAHVLRARVLRVAVDRLRDLARQGHPEAGDAARLVEDIADEEGKR